MDRITDISGMESGSFVIVCGATVVCRASQRRTALYLQHKTGLRSTNGRQLFAVSAACSLCFSSGFASDEKSLGSYHRLNGRTSAVLAATRFSRKGQISTITKSNKIWYNWLRSWNVSQAKLVTIGSVGLLGEYVKYTIFVTIFPPPTWGGLNPLTNFHAKRRCGFAQGRAFCSNNGHSLTLDPHA